MKEARVRGRADGPVAQPEEGVIKVQPFELIELDSQTSISSPQERSQLQSTPNETSAPPTRVTSDIAVLGSPRNKESEQFRTELRSELDHFQHWAFTTGHIFNLAMDMCLKLEGLEERCLILEKDNDLLREQITNMTSAQEPIHEEEWFILQFTQIGMEIESWVAKQTHAAPSAAISAANQEALVYEISTWGETGSHAADFVRTQLREINQNGRKKIGLIRHIIAVFLFEHVLDRFAFGFRREESTYFKHLEIDMCSHGSPPPLSSL